MMTYSVTIYFGRFQIALRYVMHLSIGTPKRMCVIAGIPLIRNLRTITQQNPILSQHLYNGTAPNKIVEVMCATLKCDKSQANAMIMQCPKLLRTNPQNFLKAYRLLVGHNISIEALRNYPRVLAYSSFTIRMKMKILGNIQLTNVTIPMLIIPTQKLKYILKQYKSEKEAVEKFATRLDFFSRNLNLDHASTVTLLEQHSVLLTADFGKIQRVMELMKQAGVSSEAIYNDLWLFRNNEALMRERVERARAVGVPVKTWMVRCVEEVFNRALEKWTKKVEVLGPFHDSVDYLAHRLGCNRDQVLHLADKNPRIFTVNLPKMKEVLDFLYDKGFTPQQVYRAPQIFSRSLRTMDKRLSEMAELGFHPPSPQILYLTNKLYSIFIYRLKKQQAVSEGSVQGDGGSN